MARLAPNELTVALDGEGLPAPDARRHVYHAGTDVLAQIFTDPHLTYMGPNPSRADAAGVFADCYLPAGRYRVETSSACGAPLATWDEVEIVETALDATAEGNLSYRSVTDLMGDSARSTAAPGSIVTIDGGGHAYEVQPEDALSYHVMTSGGLRLNVVPLADGYDVDAFGATGDGVTDDTAACLAAIKALDPVKGGTIRFGARHYRVNLTITGDRVRLRGTGQASRNTFGSYLTPFDPTLPAVTFIAPDNDQIYDCSIEALALAGLNANQFGLRLVNCYRGTFTDISVTGFTGKGVVVTNSRGGACAYNDFANCNFQGPSTVHGATTLDVTHLVTGGNIEDGYTTAMKFIGGSISNGALGNRALAINARTISFIGTYVQLNSPTTAEVATGVPVPIDVGFQGAGTPAHLNMTQCEIDNPRNLTGVSIQLPGTGAITDYLHLVNSGGNNLVRFSDGATRQLVASNYLSYRSTTSWPHVIGAVTLGDGSTSLADQSTPSTGHSVSVSSGSLSLVSTGNVYTRPAGGVFYNRTPATEAHMRLESEATGRQGTITLSSGGNLELRSPSGNIGFQSGGTTRFTLDGTGIHPTADNTYALGYAARRLSNIWSAAGVSTTSDARVKEDVRPLDAAEAAVAARLRGLIRTFRRSDIGDGRRHVGVIAQEVAAAFEAEGLDPAGYAVVRHDSWEAVPEETDEAGLVTRPGLAAGDRMSVDYDQLLCFVLAAPG